MAESMLFSALTPFFPTEALSVVCAFKAALPDAFGLAFVCPVIAEPPTERDVPALRDLNS